MILKNGTRVQISRLLFANSRFDKKIKSLIMKKRVLWLVVLSGIVAAGACIIQSCNSRTAEQNISSNANAFEFREKLSDYGFFSGELKALKPQLALIHYELATPLFSDYAVKDRFVLLPKGKAATYTGSGFLSSWLKLMPSISAAASSACATASP